MQTVCLYEEAADHLPYLIGSTVNSKHFTKREPELGGLIEFYRSDNRNVWSPTGINVPDYPKLAQLWWQHIGEVNSGTFTPQQTMDRLADEMDLVMSRMEAADKASNAYGGCGPRLNKPREASYWLNKPGSPKAKVNIEIQEILYIVANNYALARHTALPI